MAAFSEDFLNEDDFEADLTTFYCYDYKRMAMVTTFLRKLRTSLDIKKLSQILSGVIVCCINIILVTRTPPQNLKELQKSHRKGSNNWPMMSSILSGSEIKV